MKKFRVRVNGKSYEVEVEEIAGGAPRLQPGSNLKPLPPPAPESARKSPAGPAPASGEIQVKSPMPGTILAINVREGDSVTQGQALLVLEAMKMENEIPSPIDGTITSIMVKKEELVSTGDILLTLSPR